MGVSGAGKSSVGAALALALGIDFADGDDLHPPENIAKMAAGRPLTDEDRYPWLDRVAAVLVDGARGTGRVVACSALRRQYRDRIRAGAPGVRFVFLDGNAELVGRRQAARPGHFMPPSLLASQFATLERPDADETDVIPVAITASVGAIVQEALRSLRATTSEGTTR
jgi:gluconokinase